MHETLTVIHWPDPRLKQRAAPVTTFDADLEALIARMFELMRAEKGVGLAAPQLGVGLQLFVVNPTGDPEDDAVYINPQLSEPDGRETDEEGCLSLPGVRVDVERDLTLTIAAQDAKGRPFTETETGYVARIWQHEYDHLIGTLLLDRMGPTARLLHRKKIREMEEVWEKAHPTPPPVKSAKPARKPLRAANRRK